MTSDFLRLAAEAQAKKLNEDPKNKKKPAAAVEHRPGSRTRCESYCDARGFCSQFREYAGAAYRGKSSKEDDDGQA